MVGVSQAVPQGKELPETVVRNRSQYAKTLHRRDPDADEPRPACPTRESEHDYTEVPTAAYRPHYKLCQNPECFGGEWR